MSVVEQTYAQALADLVAKGAISADLLRRELGAVTRMTTGSAPLRIVLHSPAVPWEKKREVLDALAARLGISRLARNFLVVVAERGRTAYLEGIGRAFEQLLLDRQNVVLAEVASARPLNEAERAAIEGELSQRLGRELRTLYHTDEGLLGGFIARVGDQVYDGSLRGRLQRLREVLLTA